MFEIEVTESQHDILLAVIVGILATLLVVLFISVVIVYKIKQKERKRIMSGKIALICFICLW